MIATLFFILLLLFMANLFFFKRKSTGIVLFCVLALIFNKLTDIFMSDMTYFKYIEYKQYVLVNIFCLIIIVIYIYFADIHIFTKYFDLFILSAGIGSLFLALTSIRKIFFHGFVYQTSAGASDIYAQTHYQLLEKVFALKAVAYFSFSICFYIISYKFYYFINSVKGNVFFNATFLFMIFYILSLQHYIVGSGRFQDGQAYALRQTIEIITMCTVLAFVYNIKKIVGNKDPAWIRRYILLIIAFISFSFLFQTYFNKIYTFLENQDYSKIDFATICITSIIIPFISKLIVRILPDVKESVQKP